MHNQWFEGMSMEYLAFAQELPGFGAFGVSGRYFWMDKMNVTTFDRPRDRREIHGL